MEKNYLKSTGKLFRYYKKLGDKAMGQIVFLAKQWQGAEFQSLSIAKGASKNFNKEKFSQDKDRRHFV